MNDETILDDDGIFSRSLHFSEPTRTQLELKFTSAWFKKWPDSRQEDVNEEAAVFIGCLEGVAGAAESYLKQACAEQRRKEKLEAFANATDNFLDAFLGVDDLAVGHALFSGLSEIAPLYEHTAEGPISIAFVNLLETALANGSYGPFYRAIMKGRQDADPNGELGLHRPMMERLNNIHVQFLAYDMQNFYVQHLRAFTLGIRKSLKNMPAMDKDGYSFEFQTARFVEDYLARRQIDVTTSDTGLAGSAFIAIMELAGHKAPRAGYWIKKAKEHPESWTSFIKRSREKVSK